jgi:hypothetical protein
MPAGNDVDVCVHHRLTSGRTVIHADIEPIGLQLCFENFTHLSHELPHSCLLLAEQLEQTCDVSLWNDESVALGDRESVWHCHSKLILNSDSVPLQAAERAIMLVHGQTHFRAER